MLDSQSLLFNGKHFAVQHYHRNSTFFFSGNAVAGKEANDLLQEVNDSFSNLKSNLEMQ